MSRKILYNSLRLFSTFSFFLKCFWTDCPIFFTCQSLVVAVVMNEQCRAYFVDTMANCCVYFHEKCDIHHSFISNTFISNARLKLAKIKYKLSSTLRLNFHFLKIIRFFHPKILGDIQKNV